MHSDFSIFSIKSTSAMLSSKSLSFASLYFSARSFYPSSLTFDSYDFVVDVHVFRNYLS